MIKIATGTQANKGKVKNTKIEWNELVGKLSSHEVGKKGEKFFVGGYFKGEVREDSELIARTLITLDIDDSGMSMSDIEFALTMNLDCAWVGYSTHSHTPDNPRIRVVIPLSREVTGDEYRALSRVVGEQLDIPPDPCSYKPNQFMFTPSCEDGASTWSFTNTGPFYPVPDVIEGVVERVEYDELDVLVAAQPLDLRDEQVDAYLSAYPSVGLDYDAWLKVGMALYHQYQGSKVGFAKWVEWSKHDADRFDESVMSSKWKSFGGSANPVTMASVIHHVKATGGVVSTAKSWTDQINECETKHDLEQLVQKKIANDKTIGVVDLADLEVAVKTKFAELGVTLHADPLRKLFKPKQKRGLPDIGTNDLPLETMDNLSAVCDNNEVIVRYNVIKKDDEILIKDAQWSVDNAKSASITWLRSACHKVEMKTTNIKNFVTLLADSNQYNPVVELVTSKPWDGVSRLNDFYATVKENEAECSPKMKKTLMLRWMVGAIAAAFSPTGAMVRGVLVFQGEQYTGKTRWIDALAPKELELIKTGRSLVVHDKDSVKQILSCRISELGELDATFKKSDIAALKAFITSDMDELRRPYAAAESQYARRTVFAASVNEPKFLQDDTGNSRFWVLPITAIDHAHTLDMQQAWAEFHALWNNEKGEAHYLSKDEMEMLNRHNECFTAPGPIFEMIHSHLDWDNFDPKDCEWKQVSDVLRWIEKDNPTKYETILAGKAIQKLNFGYSKKSNGKRLVAVPKDRIFIKASDFNDRAFESPTLGDNIPF